MCKKINERGFTLVEILAAIVILGILMGVAIVSISYILNRSKTSFYANLEDQLVLAAKSYYSDHRTLLPQSIGQQRQVTIEALIKNNYLKRGQVVDYGKAACDTTTSYVKVVKTTKEDYIYTVYLQCPSYSIDEEKQVKNINISISIPDVGNAKNAQANINMSVDSEINRIASYQYTIYKNDQVVYTSTNISGDDQSSIQKTISLKRYVPGAIKVMVTVYDIYGNIQSAFATASLYDKGLPECGTIKPKLSIKDNDDWINSASKETTRTVTVGCIDGTTTCLNKQFSRTFTSDVDASYVTILGRNNEEVNCPVTVMIDKTKPSCGTKNESTTWTNSDRTVSVKCNDDTSGCASVSYSTSFNSNNTKNEVVKTENITIKDKAGNSNSCNVNVYVDKEKPTCSVSGGSTTWTSGNRTVTVTCNDGNGSGCKVASYTDTVSSTVKTKTYTVEDKAGNKGTCTANIYVDKTAPSKPVGGNIGAVSGSSTSASIKTAASGSKDEHSGFKQYLYLVTNNNTKPSKNDSRFSTSRAFTRACGTSYYAWVVAVDNVGNRSDVVALGNTKDGANQYTDWSSCSKKCGGGTQTRTNSCALITGGKSQSCNVQSCCSSTTPKYGSWSSCNVSCGKGTQSRTVTYQGSDGSVCKTTTETRECDTGKPCIPTIYNPTGGNWVNYNFSLTVNTTTDSSSVGYWQYKYANTNWTTYSNSATNQFVTTPFSFERGELVYIRICTKKGVCSDAASTYIRIDKTPPIYTSVGTYCGDPWGNGSKNYVKLYFSDVLSGLGLRKTSSWDSGNYTNHKDINFNGTRDAVDILSNADRWLGFNHSVCDLAGNCSSWNDPNVLFTSCW